MVADRLELPDAPVAPGPLRDAVGRLEPHVPWDQAFLSLRVDCYEASGDPRRETARRELLDFLSREPLPLATGISRSRLDVR